MSILIHKPGSPVKGAIALSGSKSISNRALVIRAVSGLDFNIGNLSDSEDTALLQNALTHLRQNGNREIDVNHAGTDFRFLTALLSVTEGEHFLTGSARLKQRPVGELVTVLKQLGADISYAGMEGFPPLRIRGKTIKGGRVSIRGNISSQFISALLLAAPCFEKGLELEISTMLVSRPYVDMTIAMMQQFGIEVSRQDNTILVKAGRYSYALPSYHVEGDWSSASYWYSVAALSPGCEISLGNLSEQSLQADSIAREIYKDFGVSTEDCISANGDSQLILRHTGTLAKKKSAYDFVDCPDIAQTVACTCAGLGTDAELKGLQTLRIKETDRIAALQQELEKFGAAVITSHDTLILKCAGQTHMEHSITVHTYHDHRMAMSFAPLCLVYHGVVIEDEDVVRKSYPGFWKDLEQAGFKITHLP